MSGLDPKIILVAATGFAIFVLISWQMETVYEAPFTFSPASFYGDINGTTLDVARVMFAHLRLGDTVQGDGVTSCVIERMNTGTGGPGTYTVSISQVVRFRTLMTATPGIQPHELDLADVGPP
jgi:hypothetical protein